MVVTERHPMLPYVKLVTADFNLVSLTSCFESRRGYFGTELVILCSGQRPTMIPELPPPLQISIPHQWEDVWLLTYDLTCNSNPMHDESSMESGFEPGILRR
ncbi:hypothetical protein AVEN_55751-1 [Araneus ventricosus]|uniref:Uncharacterized protein n=1 Tax=Araneus ventricosus TaxID=182803 RepID=A0A4Y2JV51_ARAVE|nr:hypothetical protein AVEN_55751-1 [Araneus ventricosus]